MSHAGHRSSRTDKVFWLMGNPEVWDKSHTMIKKELVAAGLVSPTTYVLDLHVSDLIAEAKKRKALATSPADGGPGPGTAPLKEKES